VVIPFFKQIRLCVYIFIEFELNLYLYIFLIDFVASIAAKHTGYRQETPNARAAGSAASAKLRGLEDALHI
jgi:hypothetical protein